MTNLDKLVDNKNEVHDVKLHAQEAYLNMLMGLVMGTAFGSAERAVGPALRTRPQFIRYDENVRKQGGDWAYLGMTMVGEKRLIAIKNILEDIFKKNVSGDYMETGTWRGGASIFARGVIRAHQQPHRISYVCDSFSGLPPGDLNLDARDKGYDQTPYLEVSDTVVVENFERMGLLDAHVWFVKGFFNATMPPLAPYVDTLAVLRLDGDMYESTVDVLYHMYPKLGVGSYVIVDDWIDLNGQDFPAKTACEDFFAVHGLAPTIVRTDGCSVYWRVEQPLARERLQYWRYQQKKFKHEHTPSSHKRYLR